MPYYNPQKLITACINIASTSQQLTFLDRGTFNFLTFSCLQCNIVVSNIYSTFVSYTENVILLPSFLQVEDEVDDIANSEFEKLEEKLGEKDSS